MDLWYVNLPISEGVAISIVLLGPGVLMASWSVICRAKLDVGRSGSQSVFGRLVRIFIALRRYCLILHPCMRS
jgi:hypothetical protein